MLPVKKEKNHSQLSKIEAKAVWRTGFSPIVRGNVLINISKPDSGPLRDFGLNEQFHQIIKNKNMSRVDMS